jgi:spore germination protein YaaH
MRTAVLGLRRAAPTSALSRGRAIATLGLILAIVIAAQGLAFAHPVAGASPNVGHTRAVGGQAAQYQPSGYQPGGGLQPGIQYEEAMAHERDRIAFVPGARVSVPFVPRAGDKWSVGGTLPRQLPAGQATGRDMAASAQGSRWAKRDTSAGTSGTLTPTATPLPSSAPAPVDAPTLDASDVTAANAASAVFPSPQLATSPQNAGLLRQVFGFLPYWEVGSATLNYDVLSTIAYFSVGSDAGGNLLKRNTDGTVTTGWGGWTSAEMTSIINRAHQKRTRVVLTISMFAWSTAQADKQRALLGSPAARLNLARQAAAAVRDRGADGINLDFEPIASGYADEFTAFVRTMRGELNRISTGYQLTFDTTGYIGNYPIEAATAAGAADAIFIMGYDYRTGATNPVGSLAPLTGPIYDLTDTVRAYVARVPASKLILGVPYYGRAWSTTTNQLNATNSSGSKFGSSTTVVYDSVVDYAVQYGRHWDSIEQTPWVAYQRDNCTTAYGCVTTWRQIYYDDATSLAAKYDLINRYALRGAGIWALGYDGARPELYAVLARKFLHDTTAPLTGIRNLGERVRNAGFTVSWSGQDISGIRGYDVQYTKDGGSWTTWLTATTKTSEVFLGQAGHTYGFRVRATDGKGNASAWNVSSTWVTTPALAVSQFGLVQADNLNARVAPGTSAGKAATFNTGDVVSIVGGPRTADGYTWWQVSGPVREWQPVSPIDVGVWVAAGTATDPWLVATHAPNSVLVDPVLRDFSVGDGSRAFSPNGDGVRDSLRVAWTNAQALDSLTLNIYRADGTLLCGVPLSGNIAAGAQVISWDGTVGGVRVSDGQYMLALRGTTGGVAYSAPSATPVTAPQLAAFGVAVDTVAPTAATPALVIAGGRSYITSGSTQSRVGWPRATDTTSGIAGYDVEKSRDGAAWVALTSTPASSPAVTVWLEFGHGYVYRVRARDAAGNASPWLATPPMTVGASDDFAGARYSTGWATARTASAYRGSFHRTTRTAATVSFTMTGRQLAIVGRIGPTEGSAAVYVNGVYQGTFSMYASTIAYRRSVWVKDFATTATRTVTIRALGTPRHPGINVDAFLIAR